MDYSKEGCDQNYCSINNVLIKFFVFPRVNLKQMETSLIKRVFKTAKIGCLFSVNVGCSTSVLPTGCTYFLLSPAGQMV